MLARGFVRLLAAALVLAVAAGCGDDEDPSQAEPRVASDFKVGDPGPVHVHGLGTNPADGALFVATHTGLFRLAPEEDQPRRIADRFQDTMGFAVVGRDRFLGSGHPDGRDRLPPFLGLIQSRDAGRSWKPISLLGEVDFHVLEAAGSRVYGFGSDFDSRSARFLGSADGGRTWSRLDPPEPLISLALRPRQPRQLVAAGETSLHASTDGGRRWRALPHEPGLLTWPDRLYRADGDGEVSVSSDSGQTWSDAGSLDGEPAAFEAGERGTLWAALHDGAVKRSDDGGRTWRLRYRP